MVAVYSGLKSSRPPKGVKLIAECSDNESWSGGSVTTDQYHKMRGNQNNPIKLGSTGAQNITGLIFPTTKDVSAGMWFQIDLWVYDHKLLDGVIVGLSKDTGTTNIATYTVVGANLKTGHNVLSWHQDQMVAGGTWTDDDFAAVRSVLVAVDAVASTTTFVVFQNFYSIIRKAEVLIEIDDGLITITDRFAAVCNDEYNYAFNFYIYTGFVEAGDSSYATPAQLQACQADGNIIGFHAGTISNVVESASTESEIITDWTDGIEYMDSININYAYANKYHYAASVGGVSAISNSLMRRMLASGRRNTYQAPFGLHDIPEDPYALWGYIYRPSVSNATYFGFIDDAVTQQRGMTLVFHYMTPDVGNDLAVSEENLRLLLSYCQSYERQGLLDVVTRNDILSDYEAYLV